MAETSSGDCRPLLKDLNKHIVCGLCNGYLVDATTITDCLHSFCRSCIVRQLQVSDVCPTCHKLGEVGPTTTLKSLRRDCLLQVLVYKLVPTLYQREGRERRKFRRRNSRWRDDVSSSRPEDRQDGASISGSAISIRHGSVIYVDQETINLRLEPRDTNSPNHDITSDFTYGREGTEADKHLEDTESPRTLEGTDRYFLCPVLLTIKLLKKFMRYKFSLEDNCQIDLFYCEEPLLDSYTLADLGYIFWSEKTTCMTIQYVIWKRISNDLFVSDTLLNKGTPDCVTECQDQTDQTTGESVSDGEKVSVEGEAYQNGDRVTGTNGDRVTGRNGDMVAESDVSSTSVVLQIDDVGHVDCSSESVINVCDKVNSVIDVIQPSVLKVDQNECAYNSEFVHGVSSNMVSPTGQAVYETGLQGQFELGTLEKDSREPAPVDEQRESCEPSFDRLVVSEECVATSRIGTGARVCGPSTQNSTASSKHLHSDDDFICAKRHKGESSQYLTGSDSHIRKEPSNCGDPTNAKTNNVCVTLGNFRDSSHDQDDPQNLTNRESPRNSSHSNAFHGLFAINPSWGTDRSDKNHNICREQHRQSDVKPTDIDCVDVCCDGEKDDYDDSHDPHPIGDDRNDQERSVEVHDVDASGPSDVVYNRVQDMGISTSPMFCEDEQIQHCLENLDVVSNSNSSNSADFSLNDIVDISRFSSQNSSNDMEFNHFEALTRNNAKERGVVESIEQVHNSNETVINAGSLDALDTNARSPGLAGGYGEQQYTTAKDDSCGSPILVIDSEKLSKKSAAWNLSEGPSKSEHTGFNDNASSSIITSTPPSSCDSQASVATQTAPDLICRYFSRRTAPLGLYSCNKKNSPKVSKPPRKTGLSSKFYQSSNTGNSEKNTMKMTQTGFTITSQSNVFPTFNGKNAFVITFPGNTTSMLSDNCRPRVTLFAPPNGNVATVSPVTPPLTPVNHQTDGQTICSKNSLSVPILPASTGINPVVSGRNGVKSRSSGVNVTPNLAKLLPAPIARESRPSAVLSSTATSVYTFNDNIGQNKPESDRLHARGIKKDGSKGGNNSKCTTQDTAPTPTTVINICQNGIQTTPNLTTTDNGPRRPTIIFLPPMASSNACNQSNAIAVLLPVSSSASNINAPRFNATNNVQKVNIAPALNANNNISAPRLNAINSVNKVNIAPAVNTNNSIAPRLDAINSVQKVNIAPAINANNIQVDCPPLVRITDANKPGMSPTKTATETRFRIQQTSSAQTVGPINGASSQCVNQARATVFMNNSVLGKDKIVPGCITGTPASPVPLNNGIVKNGATNGKKNHLEPILCVNKTSQHEKVNKPKKKVRFDIGTEDNMLGSPAVSEKHGTQSVNAELNDSTVNVAASMEKEKFSPIKGLPILSSIINSDVMGGIGNKSSEIKLSVGNVGSGGNVIVTSCKEKQACPKAFVSTNEMSQFLQKALIQQNAQRPAQATPEHLQRSVPSASLETQSVFHTSQETDNYGSSQNFGNRYDQQPSFEQTKSPSPSSDQTPTLSSWTEINRQEMLSAAKQLIKPCSVALPKKVYAYLGSAMSHEHIARERDSPNEATQNLLKNIDNSPTQDTTSLYLPPADQLEMSEPDEDPQPINQLRLMCKELQNTTPPSPDGDASLKSGRSSSGRRTRKRKSCTNCCQPAAKLTNSDRKVARC